MIINRRRVCGGGKSLPYDAEIAYLESTGTQYIITDYVPKGTDISIYTKIKYDGYANNGQWISWFAAYTGEQYPSYRIIRNGNSNNSILIYNSGRASGGGTSFSVTVGSTYNIVLIPGRGNINGASIALSQFNATTSGKLSIFSLSLKGRFYYFRLEKNGVIELDLVPVRVGQVGYMYDKVSGQLFGNSGTGSFILGQDI